MSTAPQSLVATVLADPNLANATAAIAGVVVAIVALFVSGLSLHVSARTLRHQREHNILSVRPLAFVSFNDYENRLKVALCNHGIGPMIVKSLVAMKGQDAKHALIEWMPRLPDGMHWRTFVPNIADRSLPAGGEIVLMTLEGDPSDQSFARARDACRRTLADIVIQVDYTDMYSSTLPRYERALDWFKPYARGEW